MKTIKSFSLFVLIVLLAASMAGMCTSCASSYCPTYGNQTMMKAPNKIQPRYKH